MIRIDVLNADVLRKALMDLSGALMPIARVRIKAVAARIVGREKVYPPKPAGSKYIRTFTLKNSWKMSDKWNGVLIENNANQGRGQYPHYVVGDGFGKRQARRMGHWNLFLNVVKEETGNLHKLIESDIGKAIKSRGLG